MSNEAKRHQDERTPHHDRPLRAFAHDKNPYPCDYPPDYPPDYPDPYREPSPKALAAAATARRLEREEISVTSGLVAGHDFKREAQERERGR